MGIVRRIFNNLKIGMKKFMRMLSVLTLLVVVSLSACKDDPAPETCQNGTFEAKVNGDLASGSSFDNTLLKAAGTKRTDIRATDANGRQLIITVSDQSTGTEGNGISTGEYIPFDDVMTGTENSFFFTIIDNDVTYPFIQGSLDITSCDADKKKVSGTFSFAGDGFEVMNGTFTDLCYTVVQ
jgi:hypothetical protein